MSVGITLFGIDENGYGPRLGPLVVTGAAVVAPAGGRRLDSPGENRRLHDLGARLAGAGTFGVRDSKQVFRGGPRDREKLEDIVLAFFLFAEGFLPSVSGDYLGRVLANGVADLAFPCPGPAARLVCLGGRPLCLEPDRRHRLAGRAAAIGTAFAAAGLADFRVRSLAFCPALFNRAVTGGPGPGWLSGAAGSKAALVTRGGLFLAAAAARDAGRFSVAAGKVGGTRDYRAPLAAFFPAGPVAPLEEGAAASRYLVRAAAGAGSIAYLRGAEEQSFLVALASLFGKYTRELFMDSINVRLDTPGADRRPASGYRDPVTARFIARSAGARVRACLPDHCFFRS